MVEFTLLYVFLSSKFIYFLPFFFHRVKARLDEPKLWHLASPFNFECIEHDTCYQGN